MKPVIHVITTIELGGAEKQLLTLVRLQRESGRDVCVVPLKGSLDLIDDLKTTGAIVNTSLIGKGLITQLLVLSKIFRSSLSIVHAHLPRAELITSLTKGKNRLILTRHNSEPFFPKAPKFLSKLLARFVSFRADILIAISKAVANYVEGAGEVSSRTPIQVVYYGYEMILPKATSFNYVLAETGLGSKDGPLIGTIGRLVPQKDYPTLIGAFKQIALEIPSAKLIILGDGIQREFVEGLIAANGIQNSVELLGKKSNIEQYLKAMDLFVLASKYEGFGLVLLEAMSSGVAIVASNNSAIPEVLGLNHPGLAETGNISDFAEKMRALLTLDGRKYALEVQSNSLLNFSPKKMIASMDMIYSQVEVLIPS